MSKTTFSLLEMKGCSCLRSNPCLRRFLKFTIRRHPEHESFVAVKGLDRFYSTLGDRSGRVAQIKSKDNLTDREFFVSVLGASATKRDAKQFLSRFNDSEWPAKGTSSNIAGHVFLIQIGGLDQLNHDTLEGLAQTFSQLTKLGIACVIVTGCDPEIELSLLEDPTQLRKYVIKHADKLVSSLRREPSLNARRLDDAFGMAAVKDEGSSTVPINGAVEVQFPDLLRKSIASGIIPVIPPLSFTVDSQKAQIVDANQIMLAITRELAGWRSSPKPKSPLSYRLDGSHGHSNLLSLDRIIILNAMGGIPSATRNNQSHIFVNLEQEYEDIRKELVSKPAISYSRTSGSTKQALLEAVSDSSGLETPINKATSLKASASENFVKNLDMVHQCLSILPPSASALFTTAEEAATNIGTPSESSNIEVRTRRPKNPLIHNLLTDKPLVSSSLPPGRISTSLSSGSAVTSKSPSATLVKRGMPLTIIPDPKTHPWNSPSPSSDSPSLTLEDPRIDLSRLVNLIEDSFNRTLDVAHYLERIRNRIAGLIIAGAYEGGAVLTWELPPHIPDDSSPASQSHLVPYLDKFAVLKRSQGAGGVADILFSAMVQRCFPQGVCWRSRRNNPVNKWYFERSAGTWKIPDTGWSMFWTTENLDRERWKDYEAVCRSVQPSWADNKQVLD